MNEGMTSSDSEMEDVEINEEDALAIMNLEKQLEDNPSNYDAHVQVTLPSPLPLSKNNK
jgi:hypothetical protein